MVSTHSRAEAAAQAFVLPTPLAPCFNTQPRGGGCDVSEASISLSTEVSTHSRAEAAAVVAAHLNNCLRVSTHSRAEAAACANNITIFELIGFNTQPRGGGCRLKPLLRQHNSRFNTQPRGGGCTGLTALGLC